MTEVTLESLYHLVENMAEYLMTKTATKDEVNQLREEVHQLREEVHQLREEVEQLREKVEQLREEVEQLREKVEQLREKVEQLREKVEQLSEDSSLIKIRLDSLEERFEKFSAEVKSRFNQVLDGMDAQAGQLDIQRTELASQSHTLDVYNIRIGDLEETILGKRVREEGEEGKIENK